MNLPVSVAPCSVRVITENESVQVLAAVNVRKWRIQNSETLSDAIAVMSYH